MEYLEAYSKFWEEFKEGSKMVLSTSLNNRVSSGNMSIIVLKENLYFQTDLTFRKYDQLKNNPFVALCADNIQIEGKCKEIGKPSEHNDFYETFKKNFKSSYDNYSHLNNERLFVIEPTFIQRWIYNDNVPYIEIIDIVNKKYTLERYEGV